jgi:hypothetical protein
MTHTLCIKTYAHHGKIQIRLYHSLKVLLATESINIGILSSCSSKVNKVTVVSSPAVFKTVHLVNNAEKTGHHFWSSSPTCQGLYILLKVKYFSILFHRVFFPTYSLPSPVQPTLYKYKTQKKKTHSTKMNTNHQHMSHQNTLYQVCQIKTYNLKEFRLSKIRN